MQQFAGIVGSLLDQLEDVTGRRIGSLPDQLEQTGRQAGRQTDSVQQPRAYDWEGVTTVPVMELLLYVLTI